MNEEHRIARQCLLVIPSDRAQRGRDEEPQEEEEEKEKQRSLL